MSHLDSGVIHALLDGEIPSSELAPIQAHLDGCADCRALLEEERRLLSDADGLIGVLDVLEVPAAAQPGIAAGRQRRWGRGLAWAATVVAAVGLGWVGRGWRRTTLRQSVASEVAAVRAADTPSTNAAVPSAGPAEQFASSAPARGKTSQRRAPFSVTPHREELEAKKEARDEIAAAPPPRVDSVAALAREPQSAPPTPAAPAAAPTGGATSASAPAPVLQELVQRTVDRSTVGALRGNTAAKVLAPPENISLPDAVRRLGGSLRLIDGMIPQRLEAQGDVVRVVYAVAQGELVLSQRLVDGRVEVTLLAPPGFPSDSLVRLRGKVRE